MTAQDSIPWQVADLAAGIDAALVWENELGGRTFRIDDRFVKWNPHSTGIDLRREGANLRWLSGRHCVPEVVDFGSDREGQWLVTAALHGESAIADRWRSDPDTAVRAIALGLRAIHAIDMREFPPSLSATSWATRTPEQLGARPEVERPVLLHGDACAPNTLIAADGGFAGHVDLVDVAVGDRWADLAVASMSLDWNYGEGFQDAFFAAYGIDPDPVRLAYYRSLWHLES